MTASAASPVARRIGPANGAAGIKGKRRALNTGCNLLEQLKPLPAHRKLVAGYPLPAHYIRNTPVSRPNKPRLSRLLRWFWSITAYVDPNHLSAERFHFVQAAVPVHIHVRPSCTQSQFTRPMLFNPRIMQRLITFSIDCWHAVPRSFAEALAVVACPS